MHRAASSSNTCFLTITLDVSRAAEGQGVSAGPPHQYQAWAPPAPRCPEPTLQLDRQSPQVDTRGHSAPAHGPHQGLASPSPGADLSRKGEADHAGSVCLSWALALKVVPAGSGPKAHTGTASRAKPMTLPSSLGYLLVFMSPCLPPHPLGWESSGGVPQLAC